MRLSFSAWLVLNVSAAMAQNACFYSVNPWCNRNADQLKNELKPAQPLRLEGMGNDWLVGAACVMADKPTDVTVTIEGSEKLRAAADIKVIGEVPGDPKDGKPTWCLDPVIADPAKLGDLTKEIRNWEAIREFPRLHLSPGQPVMLWLTVKTHSLSPAFWKGNIVLTDGSGARSVMPVEVKVHPVKLPVDNPIMGYPYTSFRERRDLAQMAMDYGMNVCRYYDNWDMCRELGFKYFSFAIPFVNSEGVSRDLEDEQVVKEGIEPIKEIIARLKLKPEEWGVEVFDEPFDELAWVYVAWGVRLRRLWPEAQFWTNLGYANQGRNRATVADSIDPMKPYVDVWCPYIKYLEPSSADVLKAIKATGKPVWYYTITYRHGLPPDGGRFMPWLAWKYDMQGWAFYSLDNYEGTREDGTPVNPWTENSCARCYPGPTPSLWLEGLRQGVQDYKRLWLLKKEGVPTKQLDGLADRALKFVEHTSVRMNTDQVAPVRQELDRMLVEKAGAAK
jgi:hypothetical protein